MGALVIESVTFKSKDSTVPVTVRTSDRLALHNNFDSRVVPLLEYAFAGGAAPELEHGRVEFLLDGAAYTWRADFDMNSHELTNRSTNHSVSGFDAVVAHMNRILPTDHRARAASFGLPYPASSNNAGDEPVAGDPPPSDELRADLARCEARLSKAGQTSLTATSLYGELFPLLESVETRARDLKLKVTQLERHRDAEQAIAELDALEAKLRQQTEAGRKARELEKDLAVRSTRAEGMRVIPDLVVHRSADASVEVEKARGQFLESDKSRKQVQDRISAIQPMRWWIAGAAGIPVVIAPMFLEYVVPFATYIWSAGAGMLLGLPWAALLTGRRSSLRRISEKYQETWTANRSTLELAEMGLMQILHPFGARDANHLRQMASDRTLCLAEVEAMQTDLAELRKISKTDDALQIHSTQESALLAYAQDRCRELAPYRLEPDNHDSIAQQVTELESDARVQQQAVSELKDQCESLQAGWSDISLQAEEVSRLRARLLEWHRWEKAFRALRDVVDQLPEISAEGDSGDQSRAAHYLKQISVGRWTRLEYDVADGSYRIFDQEADLWVRADPDNPTIRSSLVLACRLSMLEAEQKSARMPLWLVEPFDELPRAMANATASLLAEVSRQRQVVLLCRRVPEVTWPTGLAPQS